MRVVLFRPFPDRYRLSMARYGDELERRVGAYLKSGESIATVSLPQPRLEGGWRRYWDQYVRYERWAPAQAGHVNHVIDHGFAHLSRRLPPGRTVVTFHDAVVARLESIHWRTRLAFRYSTAALKSAAAVVCVSQAARQDLRSLADLPEDRVHVIPWGIDEAFQPAADRDAVRRQLGFKGNIVLMVGHTHDYMNIARMLRAVAIVVARQGIDATIIKIGLPFTPEQMRLIGDLELGDRVQFAGRVAQSDLPAYYQAADLLLYAPLLAGFGLPPVEAMACGTPVVASNRGSIPEVVGDAALLVDPEDPAGMADAVGDVLGNPSRRRQLIDAGFRCAGRYEWSMAARRMLALYRTVAHA